MTWWLSVRRTLVVYGCVLVSLVALGFTGSAVVPVPSFVNGLSLPLAVSNILPLILVTALMLGLGSRSLALEGNATRGLVAYDLAWVYVAVLAAIAGSAIVAAMGAPGTAAYVRNLLGFVGVALIVARFLGFESSALIPSGLIIVSSMFGRQLNGEVSAWAWPVAQPSESAPWAIAGTLMLLGSVALITSRPRTT